MTPSPLPTIEYGRQDDRRRRLLFRWVTFFIFTLIGLLSVRFGPVAWHHVESLYWQRQCMRYSPSPEQLAYAEDAATAAKILALNKEFSTYTLNRAVSTQPPVRANAAAQVPTCWNELATNLRIMPAIPNGTRGYGAVIFLHERTSPAGHQRLVCIRYTADAGTFATPWVEGFDYKSTIITPGARITPPKVAPGPISAFSILSGYPRHVPKMKIFAGQADPTDASHFTVRYQIWGQEDIADGYLNDNDSVSIRPRNPPTDPN